LEADAVRLGFRLQLVIDPVFVDYVELAVVPNRHTAWRLQDDEWKEQIMVP
jgi:hypothetical protein